MDDHRTVSVSRVYVPNEYTVYLSSADREQFVGYEDNLKGELQEYLSEHARREDYALLSPARVLMETDDDLDVGEFGIATRMVQPDRRRAGTGEPLGEVQPGATMVYKPGTPAPTPAALEIAEEAQALLAEANANTQALTDTIGAIIRADTVDEVVRATLDTVRKEFGWAYASYWVVDLGSTNGMEVNGKRVKRAKLADGDTITLGSTDLTFGREEH